MDFEQFEKYRRFARRRPGKLFLIILILVVLGAGGYFIAGAFEELGRQSVAKEEPILKGTQLAGQTEKLPIPASSNSSAVALEVNGSRGVVTIRNGDPYIYSWRATDQTSCSIVSPFPSGSTLAGTSSQVFPGESYYYPTPDKPVKIRMECTGTDGRSTTDEVTVALAAEGAGARTPAEDRLAEIGFTLKLQDKVAAAKAIDAIKKIVLTTDNERVRAAYHMFFAYRTLGEIDTACRQLRGVSQIASRTDYKRAIDGADANFCFGFTQ